MKIDTEEFLSLIEYFYKLKEIPRTGWKVKLKLKKPESVASHIFLMVVLTLLLSDYFKLSSNKTVKILKMVILHDLGESIIGDLTPDSIDAKTKYKLEDNAINRIFSNISDKKLRTQYTNIWFEYLQKKSDESLLVHIIDKLEMAIQAGHYLKHKKDIDKKDIMTFYKSATEYYNELSPKFNTTEYNNTIKQIKKVLDFIIK